MLYIQNITQYQAIASWGWEFCKQNVLFMLGHPYKMNNVQLEYCSFCNNEPIVFRHPQLVGECLYHAS